MPMICLLILLFCALGACANDGFGDSLVTRCKRLCFVGIPFGLALALCLRAACNLSAIFNHFVLSSTDADNCLSILLTSSAPVSIVRPAFKIVGI